MSAHRLQTIRRETLKLGEVRLQFAVCSCAITAEGFSEDAALVSLL